MRQFSEKFRQMYSLDQVSDAKRKYELSFDLRRTVRLLQAFTVSCQEVI